MRCAGAIGVRVRRVGLGLALSVLTGTVHAGSPDPERLTVLMAVDLARAHYPALRAASGRVDAARAGIDLAHVAYRPRTDLHLQMNRGTRNNISGLLLPQAVLPQVTGAALPQGSGVSRFNSGLGALMAWEPFDFGLRKARMNVARAETDQAERTFDLTLLDVAVGAADAFLVALAAQENARAAQANVTRLETFVRVVQVLAANQLRPGADQARAEAELARGRTQAIQAGASAEQSRVALGEAIGLGGTAPILDPGPLLALPDDTGITAVDPNQTPQAAAQAAAVNTARAREREVEASAKPRIHVEASLSDRGSGFLSDGRPDPDADRGLLPTTGNWASGVSVSYNLAELAEKKARRRIERGKERTEQARLEQTLEALKTEDRKTRIALKAALEVVENTPIQLNRSRKACDLAHIRFQQGLSTVSDVAEAEALLARAEVDDAVARLSVWRSLLGAARVQGNVAPWLSRVRASTPEPED